MPDAGISLNARIVIDNSVLSLLCDYWCAHRLARFPADRRMTEVENWFEEQVVILRHYTPDGKIHCTDSIASEFNPSAGRLGQQRIAHPEIQAFAQQVRSKFVQTGIEPQDIQFLRELPSAPAKLVGPQGLSDNDFSLVALSAMLSTNGEAVYLLTNDQDLLKFTSWVRTNMTARAKWQNILQVNGLHGLTYIEALHRVCKITTQDMQELLVFAMNEHYNRVDLRGTDKGSSIMQQLTVLYANFTKSVQIKLARNGGVS